MNCTYKINRYKMLLFMINEVIAMNIIFYIIFAFLFNERITDFN